MKNHYCYSETMLDALYKIAYDFCDAEGQEKYNFHDWIENCDTANVPSIEVVHDFLKHFVPRELRGGQNEKAK